MAEEQRLERMENKIDELTKVVTSMARIEERMITLFKRMDAYDTRHAALVERVDEMENGSTRQAAVFGLFDKVFWLILGAGLAFAVKVFGE